jgi:hypothetical protein
VAFFTAGTSADAIEAQTAWMAAALHPPPTK